MSYANDLWSSVKGSWSRMFTSVKHWLSVFGLKVFGPVIALVVVIGGFLLLTMGFKELQIGGLLGKLMGKTGPVHKPVEVANTVDPDRVGSDGKLILPGTPDAIGDTQAIVVPIRNPGLLSDPGKVTFTAPGDTTPTTVHLPEGLTNTDVTQVVVVKPEVVAVVVKDTSKHKVDASKIDDILKKYGR
jgi:hypothetical protein